MHWHFYYSLFYSFTADLVLKSIYDPIVVSYFAFPCEIETQVVYSSDEEKTSKVIYNVSLDKGKRKRGKALVY